jgi:hypothetical protein
VRFDPDALPGDLHWRSADPERDRFRPWGHAQTRSLGHFLARAGVPRHRQEALLVLASGSELYWVVGLRRAALAAVEQTPENACVMRATAHFWV